MDGSAVNTRGRLSRPVSTRINLACIRPHERDRLLPSRRASSAWQRCLIRLPPVSVIDIEPRSARTVECADQPHVAMGAGEAYLVYVLFSLPLLDDDIGGEVTLSTY